MSERGFRHFIQNPPLGVPHLHTVILLHDKTNDANGFGLDLFAAECTQVLHRPRHLNELFNCFRWIFVEGPFQDEIHPEKRKWFDTPDMGNPHSNSTHLQPHLEYSIDGLMQIIRAEERIVPRRNIFIGGHGQGFAVAAATFLVDGEGDFGGLIGLNGWLPYATRLTGSNPSEWVNNARAMMHPSKCSHLLSLPGVPSGSMPTPPVSATQPCGIIQKNASGERITPIFIAHPHYDDVVSCAESAKMSDIFMAMGWEEVNWEDYPLDNGDGQQWHWLNVPLGVDHLFQWLNNNLGECPRHQPHNGHLLNGVDPGYPDGHLPGEGPGS